MANDEEMKEAIETERRLKTRRPLKSVQTPISRPYYSNQEASRLYEKTANKWLSYIESLRPSDRNYSMQEQYVKNALEDLRSAKKLAYDKQDKARIDADIDRVKSRLLVAEKPKNGKSLEKTTSSFETVPQRLWAYLSIISLAAALLSISLKWTGSVVGPAATNDKWIGLCLFLIGCMFTFLYFRAKRK
jgi:hypothetical protein